MHCTARSSTAAQMPNKNLIDNLIFQIKYGAWCNPCNYLQIRAERLNVISIPRFLPVLTPASPCVCGATGFMLALGGSGATTKLHPHYQLQLQDPVASYVLAVSRVAGQGTHVVDLKVTPSRDKQ
jgi:hypothetical protein